VKDSFFLLPRALARLSFPFFFLLPPVSPSPKSLTFLRTYSSSSLFAEVSDADSSFYPFPSSLAIGRVLFAREVIRAFFCAPKVNRQSVPRWAVPLRGIVAVFSPPLFSPSGPRRHFSPRADPDSLPRLDPKGYTIP